MLQKGALFEMCLLVVLHAAYSHPVISDKDVEDKAKKYAELFPNTGSNEIECHVVDADYAHENRAGLRQVVVKERLWPNNTLPYTINSTDFTVAQVARMEKLIHLLQKYLSLRGKPCIEFKHRELEKDYVAVRRSPGRVCFTPIGRRDGGQYLNILEKCLIDDGTIMHELFHSLGVFHEQSRDDRDNFVDINWNNIQKDLRHNFYKVDGARLIDHYDYGSLMHYGAFQFAIDKTIRTIITKQPAEIGQQVKPSPVDIERIQILYGCLQPADSVYFKHLVDVS